MRRPTDTHMCPLLNRTILWGECWIVQDICDDNTDMEFAPEPFDTDDANDICSKCQWYIVSNK